MFARILLIVSVLLLSACLPVDDFTQSKIDARRAAATKIHKLAESSEAVQRLLSNTTTKVWNVHGTQIEYLASDGRTFLWYPGNTTTVPGRWKLQMARYGLEMCFLYGGNSRNPVTGQQGGNWQCDLAAYYILNRDEVVAGDPFRLAKRIPYVQPGGTNVSIAQAMGNAGFGPLRTPNKAPAPQYPVGQ